MPDSQPLAGQFTPSNHPTFSYPTPHWDDLILIEPVNTAAADYAPLKPHAPYPDPVKYPAHFFLRETPGKWPMAVRYWGSPRLREDDYNWAIGYGGEVNAHPIFLRSYVLFRGSVALNGPATKLSALTSLYCITLTAAGSGYEPNSSFELIFSGGTGSGAAGTAVTDRAGVVSSVFLTSLGSYTAVPTVSFLNGGPGAGAAATVILQPATAILVKEDVSQLDPGDPFYATHVRVVRVYETLPGPPLIDARIDETFGFPIRYTEEKTRIQTPTTPVASLTVAGDIISNNEIQATANKYVSIQIVGKLDVTTLTGTLLYGTPFAQIFYASRNYNWPSEVRGVQIAPVSILDTRVLLTSQRYAGYSGPTDCFVGRKFTVPTADNLPAQPSRVHVPVKWFTDEVATQSTTDTTAPGSPIAVGNLLNHALHDVTVVGLVTVKNSGSPVGGFPYAGTEAGIPAAVAAWSTATSISTDAWAFDGSSFPATNPVDSSYASIFAVQGSPAVTPGCTRDFGATFANDYGMTVEEAQMICIGVENHPHRFGIMIEDYWFAAPISNRDANRDFTDVHITG